MDMTHAGGMPDDFNSNLAEDWPKLSETLNQVDRDLLQQLAYERSKNSFLSRRNFDLLDQATKLRVHLAEAVRKILVLEESIHIDEKTGLQNERYLMDVSPAIFSSVKRQYEARRIAGQNLQPTENFIVVYIDVNGLKKINDNLGHGAGDILITTFAQALAHAFKRESDLRIRKSGDEFVLLLQGTDLLTARAMLEKRFFQINETTSFIYDNFNVQIRCGYGAIDYCGQGDFGEMLKEADILLYNNKLARKKLGLTTTALRTPS